MNPAGLCFLIMSLSRTVLQDKYSFCPTFLPTCYPPLSLSLLPLVSELLSLSLSLPELTTQEVTTDSINSSYINPAIIAPHACLSAPHPSLPLHSLSHTFLLSSHPLFMLAWQPVLLIKLIVHFLIAIYLDFYPYFCFVLSRFLSRYYLRINCN